MLGPVRTLSMCVKACIQMYMLANLDLKQCTSSTLLKDYCSAAYIFSVYGLIVATVSIFAYLKYEIALSIIVAVEKWHL